WIRAPSTSLLAGEQESSPRQLQKVPESALAFVRTNIGSPDLATFTPRVWAPTESVKHLGQRV
ncbi:hypothetical protein K0M31_016978, partial [Melipona bicolor]